MEYHQIFTNIVLYRNRDKKVPAPTPDYIASLLEYPPKTIHDRIKNKIDFTADELEMIFTLYEVPEQYWK